MLVATHHTNPIAVEADVVSVGLDGDHPTIEATLPYIRKPAPLNGLFPDVLQIRWFQPITRLWEEWPKFESPIQIALAWRV